MSNAHALPVAGGRDSAMPWLVERLYVRIVWLVNVLFPGPARLAQPLDDDARAVAAARPPIVLVYGMGCSRSTWNTWQRSLVEDGFRVHVIDVPATTWVRRTTAPTRSRRRSRRSPVSTGALRCSSSASASAGS